MIENLKSSSSRQLRVVTSPTPRVVAEVQVYPVAVEVVRRLDYIVLPEMIFSSKVPTLCDRVHLNVLLPPVAPTALLLLIPAAAFKRI